ncbi:hypothetical protein [Frigoribacterium sp. NPDC087798]|uniref:hypothetical protein n=1 Tax=Frigoribacterium sp. NPDC087798 TaxID=3363993 RepID=UPI003830F21D
MARERLGFREEHGTDIRRRLYRCALVRTGVRLATTCRRGPLAPGRAARSPEAGVVVATVRAELFREAVDRRNVRLKLAEESAKFRAAAAEREAEKVARQREFEASLPVVDPALRGMPPLVRPKARSDHERTAAIDAYVMAQPYQAFTTDALLPLFPRFTERCFCLECDAIKKTYQALERQELFPRVPR